MPNTGKPPGPSQLEPVTMVKRFTPVIALVGVCWLVFVINNLVLGGDLNRYGIVPRDAGRLPAILWAPLLHGSLEHLTANTVPLLILGAIICGRGKGEFGTLLVAGTILSGGLTWLFGRSGSHIGASGLVFCFFGYLASLAYFRRTFGTLVLSAACIVAYGGMLRGLLPTATAISWEGHIAGLATGIAVAWISSKLRDGNRPGVRSV